MYRGAYPTGNLGGNLTGNLTGSRIKKAEVYPTGNLDGTVGVRHTSNLTGAATSTFKEAEVGSTGTPVEKVASTFRKLEEAKVGVRHTSNPTGAATSTFKEEEVGSTGTPVEEVASTFRKLEEALLRPTLVKASRLRNPIGLEYEMEGDDTGTTTPTCTPGMDPFNWHLCLRVL